MVPSSELHFSLITSACYNILRLQDAHVDSSGPLTKERLTSQDSPSITSTGWHLHELFLVWPCQYTWIRLLCHSEWKRGQVPMLCIFCCEVFSQFGHVDQAPSLSRFSVNQNCDCQLVPIKQKNKQYVSAARCRYSRVKSTRPTRKQYKPRFKNHMFMLCDPIGHAM